MMKGITMISSRTMMMMTAVMVSWVAGHMEMVVPAPRRSQQSSSYLKSGIVDYNMMAPLNSGYAFPCRGYGPGPITQTYRAGDAIQVKLQGGAAHNGGHCQFSLSYNDKDFAVIKTVLGTCMVDTKDYQVVIPQGAPEGRVTLAWSWINRTGQREYYMNCADIYIKGNGDSGGLNSSKVVVGPRMLVADLPGYETFPEGFSNNYGEDKVTSQATITISPSADQPSPSSSAISSSSSLSFTSFSAFSLSSTITPQSTGVLASGSPSPDPTQLNSPSTTSPPSPNPTQPSSPSTPPSSSLPSPPLNQSPPEESPSSLPPLTTTTTILPQQPLSSSSPSAYAMVASSSPPSSPALTTQCESE